MEPDEPNLEPIPVISESKEKKPEMGLHARVERLERAVQALLNSSTNSDVEEAFSEVDIQNLNGIIAQDDWG